MGDECEEGSLRSRARVRVLGEDRATLLGRGRIEISCIRSHGEEQTLSPVGTLCP